MPRFAQWMYSVLREYLGARVLDAGAGLGTYTELLLSDGREVIALEYDEAFVRQLMERFGARGVAVHQVDLGDAQGLPSFEPVNSTICLNVLEHVQDDVQALRNLHARTTPGGVLVILVPAYPWLLNTLDIELGHFRRYRKQELFDRLAATGWRVEKQFRFNAFGVPGWAVAGMLRRKTPGRTLRRVYDWLVPAFAASERYVIRGLWGLSLVAICRRIDAEGRDEG